MKKFFRKRPVHTIKIGRGIFADLDGKWVEVKGETTLNGREVVHWREATGNLPIEPFDRGPFDRRDETLYRDYLDVGPHDFTYLSQRWESMRSDEQYEVAEAFTLLRHIDRNRRITKEEWIADRAKRDERGMLPQETPNPDRKPVYGERSDFYQPMPIYDPQLRERIAERLRADGFSEEQIDAEFPKS